MNVEIGAEAALFPEKEYISGIFVAVHQTKPYETMEWRRSLDRQPLQRAGLQD
jgi:hypothetical protein